MYVIHNKCLWTGSGWRTGSPPLFRTEHGQRDMALTYNGFPLTASGNLRQRSLTKDREMTIVGQTGKFAVQQFSEFEFGTLSKPLGFVLVREGTVNSWLEKVAGYANEPAGRSPVLVFFENRDFLFNGALTCHNVPPFAWKQLCFCACFMSDPSNLNASSCWNSFLPWRHVRKWL